MKISSSIGFSVMIVMVFVFGMVWADTNGVWHKPSDVGEGVFGTDEGATFYGFITEVFFDDVVEFNENVMINKSIVDGAYEVDPSAKSEFNEINASVVSSNEVRTEVIKSSLPSGNVIIQIG